MMKVNLLRKRSLAGEFGRLISSMYGDRSETNHSGGNSRNVATITYLERGQRKTRGANNLEELQFILDGLRRNGAQICEIRQERIGLKEALWRMALRDGSQ